METMAYRERSSFHHGGTTVARRELRPADAASLLALLTTEAVSRFISPPPASVAGVERFIAWTHEQRRAGQYACRAVVPRGSATAIGMFQLRALDSVFGIAEGALRSVRPIGGPAYSLTAPR